MTRMLRILPRRSGEANCGSYGMTTLSVREYVLGIYRKLGLDPGMVRKLQTGGPDGDLGSNEIKLANEKYTAVGRSQYVPAGKSNLTLWTSGWIRGTCRPAGDTQRRANATRGTAGHDLQV